MRSFVDIYLAGIRIQISEGFKVSRINDSNRVVQSWRKIFRLLVSRDRTITLEITLFFSISSFLSLSVFNSSSILDPRTRYYKIYSCRKLERSSPIFTEGGIRSIQWWIRYPNKTSTCLTFYGKPEKWRSISIVISSFQGEDGRSNVAEGIR